MSVRAPLALLGAAVLLMLGCGPRAAEPTPPRDSAVADGPTDGSSADVEWPGTVDGPTSPPDVPPAVEDTSGVEDFGPPPEGFRIEGLIGPEGGTLTGLDATPLAGVQLIVPAGALTASILVVVDAHPPLVGPGGAPLVSPFVRVGPEGLAFAVPARLRLPWTTTAEAPQLAMVARIGFAWSSLQDPTGDGASVTASMRRASGAAVVRLDLSSSIPQITAVSPEAPSAGSVLFIEGSGFGLAQVFRPAEDGGAPFVSNVTYGGVLAETLGWTHDTISIRVPEADGGGVVVTTPGGSAP